MREIKFRGKRVDNNEWVCGSHIEEFHQEMTLTGYNHYISKLTKPYTRYLVQIPTICQYIELTDKNGTEIYEGDIIKTNFGKLFLVKWIPRTASFCYVEICKDDKGEHYLSKVIRAASYEVEVVDNIYDNKELLKEEGK